MPHAHARIDLRVLVVDDDALARTSTASLLARGGFATGTAEHGLQAIERLEQGAWDVVVTDLRMPIMDGRRLLAEIGRRFPGVDVILVTAHGDVESAVEAMRLGARDFLLKPFSAEVLAERLGALAARRAERHELASIREAALRVTAAGGLVGSSPGMRLVSEQIRLFAPHEAPVLVTGETGTGKELVARLLHSQSGRAAGPFVAVGCGTVPRELAESELFGHERGAFTGAIRAHRGLFEQAAGGTLLLDDVDDMPLDLQVKLLRVLEQGCCMRVGSSITVPIDVRVLATTKIDLAGVVAGGRFRADLYYRLRGLELTLPPLRERPGDVLLLAHRFLEEQASMAGRVVPAIEPDVAQLLAGFHWPGNVRELRHTMEAALIRCDGERLEKRHLPAALTADGADIDDVFALRLDGVDHVDHRAVVHEFERKLLAWAMRCSGGEQAAAAQRLSLPRTTLQSKLRQSAQLMD